MTTDVTDTTPVPFELADDATPILYTLTERRAMRLRPTRLLLSIPISPADLPFGVDSAEIRLEVVQTVSMGGAGGAGERVQMAVMTQSAGAPRPARAAVPISPEVATLLATVFAGLHEPAPPADGRTGEPTDAADRTVGGHPR